MVDDAEGSAATKLTRLRRELAAKDVEVCALREKLRASNFAQQALESRLLELERGELNGEHQDSPETATPPVHVLDLDTLCLPRDVEVRLGLGVGSGVVSDPALPPAATGGWTVQQRCTGLPGSGEVHWEAPAVAVATGDTGTATGDVGQPMPAASNTAGAGGLSGPTGGPSPAPALRAVTLESVRRGAEAAGATVTLAVVEDMGEGGPLSLLGRWGRRVLYASPAYVRLVDAGSEEAAVRGMDAAIAANTAIRSSLAGFLKLLLVGGDTAPALLRNVYYHPDRRAEMVFMWVIPVLVVQEAHVRRCLDRGRTLEQLGSGPPRLGFVSYTDKASSLAREVESGLREHMCLKYTPTPVTMVDGEGFVVMQNAASITSIGIQGSEGRTAGSCRLNYLQELFVSDPTANDDMRAVTSTGRTWSRRLRVSDSPLLRAWMQLGPREERWHEVAISRFRDPAYRAPVTACIVAETDVTATVLAERRVLALQRQQQALLREILPQQVIDVLLCHLEAPPDDSTSPFCSDQHMAHEGLAAVARCSGSGMGIPMTRQQAALARSRTDPVAALGLHAAGAAAGLMDGGSSFRPGCDIPAGRSFPACAASVESSSLCSSVVNSSYTAAGLPAGGAVDGANRFLAAAAASGAVVPEGAGSGRPRHLRGCTSVGGETPPHHPATAMLHGAGVGDTMREAAQLENDLAGPAGSIAESAARLGERSLSGGWQQVSGSPALGDSDDVGHSGGAAGEATNPDRRMLRGTSSAGYSDCSGRGLSRRDVMALATWHESVTVVFADVVGFTSMCQQLHPARVMAFLDDLYNAFDHLLDRTGCYKVETIGDCYMVCSGLLGRPPSPRLSSSQHGRPPEGAVAIGNQSAEAGGAPEAWGGSGGLPEQAPAPPQLGGFDPDHASHALEFAKGLVQVASSILTPMGAPVQMRVGLHSGSVVSGVVGRRMPRFCLFGDTVNTASRMESTGAPGRIHVSEATRALLLGERWEPRGTGIDVKGRGRMQTCWLWDGISGSGGHSGGDSSSANLPSRSGSGAIPAAPASDEPEGSGSGRVASAAVQ